MGQLCFAYNISSIIMLMAIKEMIMMRGDDYNEDVDDEYDDNDWE